MNARRTLRTAIALTIAVPLLALVGPGRSLADPVKEVKVGFIFSYTGASASIGKRVDDALAAYAKRYGDSAGGAKITFIKRDDTGIAPDTAARLAQELIVQDHVDLLAGLTFTPNAIAVERVSTQTKKPLIIVNAATSGILEKAPYAVRLSFTTAQLTYPLGRYVAARGAKTAVTLFQDYGPGIDSGTSFEKSFTGAGGKIVDEIRVPVHNSDFSAYIQRIRDAKPDALFVFLNATGGAAQFLQQFGNSGMKSVVPLYTVGDLINEAEGLPLVGAAALGVISSSNYSAVHNSALNRQFVADFAAIDPSITPDPVAVQAYDTARVIYSVVAAQHGSIDPDKTLALLKGMKFESPRGPVLIDAQTRDPVQNVYIRKTGYAGGKMANIEIQTYPMVKDPLENY